MMPHDRSPAGEDTADSCTGCALHDRARRAFLHDATRLAAGLLVALGAGPERAAALVLRATTARARQGSEAAYALPAQDGAEIDRDNAVILVRWQNAIHAFALSCPHQNTALRYLDSEQLFQCPKHKSRYRMDGTFISGRATRGMDRYALRRDGGQLFVNLDALYREDENQAEWEAAVVRV